MPRNLSFALTTQQVLTETKFVTRRQAGLAQLKAGSDSQRRQAMSGTEGWRKGAASETDSRY